MAAGIPKTFSIKNGLDVANTIIVDSNRNLSNIVGLNAATLNVTTANATTFITTGGLNVTNQANTARNTANDAYAQANAAYTQANAARNQANTAYNAANTKLALAGGNMTGAIDMGNNFISGIRGLYFDEIYGDSAEDQINFYRDGTSWDSLVAWNGVLYFTPGRTGSTGTLNKVWHEGNDGTGSGLDADTVDGIHGSVITSAYNQANAAYGQANAAYAKANAPLTVREIYTSNSTVVNTFANINTIQFDTESGLAVVDESNNAVTIQLNSTFKYWNINGDPGLVATGLDTVNFIGDGITITANNNASPKSITFTAVGGGGSGTSVIESDTFSANGVQNTFTLTRSTTTDKAIVFISGVAQVPQVDYQVAGKTLSFNTAPLNGTTIEVRSIVDVALVNVSSFISDTFTANGVQNTFTLSGEPYSQSGVFVFVDGVTQKPNTDYTISGNTVTFTTPPESNGEIEIRSVIAVQLPQNANNIIYGSSELSVSNSALNFTSGGFNVPADSIARTYILRGITTGNTETEIYLDAANTRIPVSTNTTVFYSADIVARRTDATGECAGYQIKGVADNFSGTVADVGDLYELIVAEDDSGLNVDARADDTNNTINFYVTGSTGKTIRWTALVKTVEVAQ